MEFLREETYAAEMQEVVLPALMAARREYEIPLSDGAKLFAVRYEAKEPRGSAVILHGLGENVEKYRELCYYFLKSGLTVLVFEQRGHGRSTRVLEKNLIHIERFSRYVEDLAEVMERERASLPAPRYLFTHSMGGAVGALYLARGEHGFAGALLSSPMIAMQYRNVPRAFGIAVSAVACAFGCSRKKFLGLRGPVSPELEDFAKSGATSRARFEAHRSAKREDVRLHAASATYAWAREALACTRALLKKGTPESIGIPLRLYAAEGEELVLAGPQRKFAARAPRGEFRTVRGAKHEIYFSKDEVAHPYFAEVLAFFDAEI